ncbi:protease, putative [Plasmodium ovale curtisi]|uniref:Protease, putative n=1 Tax=Plasmodium ovale curtisi TaxID=864141 RepID=A0A1A8WPE1_PLAOA|nr:protease, putative [Plasmodium ovale curtisi]SBS94752.1 protease, putative [Plasmodium ovale curtisi]
MTPRIAISYSSLALCILAHEWKNSLVNQYRKIRNKNGAKLYTFKVRKRIYNYKKGRDIHLFVHGEEQPDGVQPGGVKPNVIKEYIHYFFKIHYTIFTKTLRYAKNTIQYVKENLSMSSVKKQLIISIIFFFLHFYLLSTHFLILFPYQLIPNHSNILMSLDLNNSLVLLSTLYFIKDFRKNIEHFKKKLQLQRFTLQMQENKKKNILSISVLLIASYILSGYVSVYTHRILSLLSHLKFTLSDNVIKSLQILTGHFIWVGCSVVIFRKLLYPYFKNGISNLNFRYEDNWVPSVMYGYMCSHFIFNIVDVFNNLIVNYFNTEEIYMDSSIDDIFTI